MTMLTYESLWLEADQLIKLNEFIEKLGITHFTVQRDEKEGVSTVTIPEISLEHWDKVEDFEFNLLYDPFNDLPEIETDPDQWTEELLK